MTKNFKLPYRRNFLCAAISLSLFPLAGNSLGQDATQVEEVVVTGSIFGVLKASAPHHL